MGGITVVKEGVEEGKRGDVDDGRIVYEVMGICGELGEGVIDVVGVGKLGGRGGV